MQSQALEVDSENYHCERDAGSPEDVRDYQGIECMLVVWEDGSYDSAGCGCDDGGDYGEEPG